MHGSWGNMIDAEDAFERMGADVMRWQYCAQPPDRNLLFGFGPAHEIKRKLLTLWNSVRFLVDYANIEGFGRRYDDLEPGRPASCGRSTAGSSRGRTRSSPRRPRRYEAHAHASTSCDAFEAFVDDLSNWYIRRSRRRFYDDDEAAFRTLWYALVQALRVIAPVMPFLAEHLWQNLVAGRARARPSRSSSPAGPSRGEPRRRAARARSREVRRVVELGRQARASRGPASCASRCAGSVVAGRRRSRARTRTRSRDELRVKEVEFGAGRGDRAAREAEPAGARPEARRGAGARCGAALADGRVRGARRRRAFRVAGHELEPGRGARRAVGREGWAVASDDGVTVALDTALDAELELEGRAST